MRLEIVPTGSSFITARASSTTALFYIAPMKRGALANSRVTMLLYGSESLFFLRLGAIGNAASSA